MKKIQIKCKNSWNSAGLIREGSDNHENHFGCVITDSGDRHGIIIESVEHARAIIEALEKSITSEMLFTEEQIKRYNTKVTDTRKTLKDKMYGYHNKT